MTSTSSATACLIAVVTAVLLLSSTKPSSGLYYLANDPCRYMTYDYLTQLCCNGVIYIDVKFLFTCCGSNVCYAVNRTLANPTKLLVAHVEQINSRRKISTEKLPSPLLSPQRKKQQVGKHPFLKRQQGRQGKTIHQEQRQGIHQKLHQKHQHQQPSHIVQNQLEQLQRQALWAIQRHLLELSAMSTPKLTSKIARTTAAPTTMMPHVHIPYDYLIQKNPQSQGAPSESSEVDTGKQTEDVKFLGKTTGFNNVNNDQIYNLVVHTADQDPLIPLKSGQSPPNIDNYQLAQKTETSIKPKEEQNLDSQQDLPELLNMLFKTKSSPQPDIYCDDINLTELKEKNAHLACCANMVVYDVRSFGCVRGSHGIMIGAVQNSSDHQNGSPQLALMPFSTTTTTTTTATTSSTTTPSTTTTTTALGLMAIRLPSGYMPLVCNTHVYYLEPLIAGAHKCCGEDIHDLRFEYCQQSSQRLPISRYRVVPLDPTQPTQRVRLDCGSSTTFIFATIASAEQYNC